MWQFAFKEAVGLWPARLIAALPALTALTIALLVALCMIARRRPEFAPYRDAALGMAVYSVPALFFWSSLHSQYHHASICKSGAPWGVAYFNGVIALSMAACVWEFCHKNYRWYREPVITIFILAILWAILMPTYFVSHCYSPCLLSAQRHPAHVTPR